MYRDCVGCGKPFKTFPSWEKLNRVYCSIACKSLLRELPAGTKIGRLTVIRRHDLEHYICGCECGNETTVRKTALSEKAQHPTRSCGCLQRDHMRELGQARITHGGRSRLDTSRKAEYEAYRGAKNRCNNPNEPAYTNYGGRGIRFEFKDFEEWYAVLGPKPGSEYSVDRIDVNQGYRPGNVRWATRQEQNENTRLTVRLLFRGEHLTFNELAERSGKTRGQIRDRFYRGGWCVECITSLPVPTRVGGKRACEHQPP